ncbi:MAG: acyl--CoA ligase [Candidatus Zixiibacteriota bacterium]|nr:MAG: acyl--CoA ligase [candidate division Zixibacteria bacterium]
MNIAENFLATAKRLHDKPFLVGPDDVSYTYAEILSRARRFASLLESNGIHPGDKIILTFPNSVDYLVAYLGSLFCSCTLIMVDFRSRPGHLEYVRTNCGAALWVTPVEREEFNSIPGQIVFPADIERFPEMNLSRLCSAENPLALIMYTSGATGIPKGVRLTHSNLSHTMKSITSWAQINENDRELTTLSLTHLFGLAHIHIYWTLGGTVFIEEKLHDIPRLLQKIPDKKITSFPGTPGGFKMILDQYADLFKKNAVGIKYIIVNSAPMAQEYIERILELAPKTRFYMYYGLTEASRSSYICYNDNPGKLKTVGRPTPGTDICIDSPARPLVDKVGEILIRGPHVTEGYFGIDSTRYFNKGWLKTGDSGIMDQDGFLTWKGRIKEQINVDGMKLTPMEVEAVLLKHERVKDCATVGVPDEMTGESVVSFVVTDSNPDKELEIELRKFCKNQLEVYKIPRRIIFIDKIPRTDSGKIKRISLKDRLGS